PVLILDIRKLLETSVGGMHGRVHGVEGQVEEEGLLLMTVDEGRRLLRKDVSQVTIDLDLFLAAVNGPIVLVVGLQVGVSARQEAKELAKATVERVELFLLAQVPFADQACGVARRLEPIGDGHFCGGESLSVAASGKQGRVELMAKALLIAPRHQ